MSLGEATHLATRYQDHISPVASAGLGMAVQSARKLHLEVRRVQLTASLLLRPKGANQGCNNHSAQGQPTIPSRPTSKHCTINTNNTTYSCNTYSVYQHHSHCPQPPVGCRYPSAILGRCRAPRSYGGAVARPKLSGTGKFGIRLGKQV